MRKSSPSSAKKYKVPLPNPGAEFHIPASVSPLAQDLLRRMIQANPSQRIRISEIKTHPWMRREIPLYNRVASFGTIPSDKGPDIDEEVRSYNMESLCAS
jgi:serine/threonine protein kinase